MMLLPNPLSGTPAHALWYNANRQRNIRSDVSDAWSPRIRNPLDLLDELPTCDLG
jgi:hypothetical protein